MLARARGMPGIALLDSGGPAWGRTSVLGVGGEIVASWPAATRDPFAAVRDDLARYTVEHHHDWPFTGGLIGWFGYDMRTLVEELPDRHPRGDRLPSCLVMAYRVCALRDETSGRCEIVWLEDPEDEAATRRARELAAALRTRLVDPAADPGPVPAAPRSAIRCEDRTLHEDAVRAAIRHISAGDVYQVNLAQKFTCRRPRDLIGFYRRLREENPAAFGAFIPVGDDAVLSVSPERFVSVDGRRVLTRPIKGTAPRAPDPAEDAARARDLRGSAKDRAELSMIVDVLRNDLSRCCDPGSVRVLRSHVLESHPTVHHLVADIEGTLASGRDRVDLLRATLPGGSITGAPRIRAMEIIDDLERNRRGVYCGSLGYLGYDGRMDLNILIRTVVASGDQLSFFGGGGIVADSDPGAEYDETLDKVRGIIRSITGVDAADAVTGAPSP